MRFAIPKGGRCSLASLAAVAVALVIAACGAKADPNAKYPARPAGCDVTVYQDAPTVDTDNIGTVSSVCAEGTPDSVCLRELQDQACKLGADVVWGVPSKPKVNQAGKSEFSGRAAHTKAAAAGDGGA